MSGATKERPILFSGEMVRALLAGKSQTRRPVKPQPAHNAEPVCWGWSGRGNMTATAGITEETDLARYLAKHCPYGAPGDRLWVRETFWVEHESGFDEARGVSVDWGAHLDDPTTAVQYVATPPNPEDPGRPGAFFGPDEIFPERTWVPWGEDWSFSPRYSKKPGIHMPRWASRLLLEVTDVRVERLWSITAEDARAEGMEGVRETRDANLRETFLRRWDGMYGGGEFACARNPWVWVVGVARITPAAEATNGPASLPRPEAPPSPLVPAPRSTNGDDR